MDINSSYARPRPSRKPSEYALLPEYCDSKAAADYFNQYGRDMPEEWLPTNLTICRRALKTGRRLDYKYYYQKRPMREEELQAIKRDYPPLDIKPSRTATAPVDYYAAANMNGFPGNRLSDRPAFRPSSISQPPPMELLSMPPAQMQPPQQYMYTMPLPSGVGPPSMQPTKQRPQRPYGGRQSAVPFSESDYDSYDSYDDDDRPPRPAPHKHHKKKPLSTVGKLNKAYEDSVLEPLGGAFEALFGGSSKKKPHSSRHSRPPTRDSYTDSSSSSMSSDEEDYERRRPRSSAPRQDLRRSSLANAQRTRLDSRMVGQYDTYRHSVCV